MHVLIPAYQPGPQLAPLVADLRAAAPELDVLVVDDGSGDDFAGVFAAVRAAGARVICHDVNRGKGAALKTGFAELAASARGAGVVTADADGQHTVHDIVAVAAGVQSTVDGGVDALVLGVRTFGRAVPARSRFGNVASRLLFQLATGRRISDTQTGLRGLPGSRLTWALSIPGDGFEYEQRMLLRAAPDAVDLYEVPIDTVYLGRNESSHFRPVRDSLKVLLPVLLFAGSSLAAFVVDTLALLLLTAVTGSLIASIITARAVSASVNFVVNRRMVFRARGSSVGAQASRYAVLALALLASNIAWMSFLTDAGLALLPAKVITEGVLFILSYGVQRSLVFPPSLAPAPGAAPPRALLQPVPTTSSHTGRNR